jgi:hypothetical protein
MRKGFLFSVDALIASIAIISAILIFSTLYVEEADVRHLQYTSDDMLGVLSELRVSELNNSYVQYLIAQGEIKNINNTLLEQIGEFWAFNKTDICGNFTRNITEELFPENKGYSITVGNEEMYRRNFSTHNDLVASRKMISGYEKSKPIKGSTSRAYLKSIREKTYSSFAYFGGFVGQGNISVFIDDVPSGVDVTEMYMELDAGDEFTLLINNIPCMGVFTPTDTYMSADSWNITGCSPFFSLGTKNTFTLIFAGDISESYVGGGYIEVKYTTDEMQTVPLAGKKTEWLPYIKGIINIYSSFYVPGALNNMTVYLHFFANNTNTTNNTL